jgi:hypothetical protein
MLAKMAGPSNRTALIPHSEVAGQERLQPGVQLGRERKRLVECRRVLGDVFFEEVVDPVEVHEVEPGRGFGQACGEVAYLGASEIAVGVAAGEQHGCMRGELGR